MEWTRYTGQHIFPFDYPVGWKVEVTALPSCIVTSPDGLWIVLIQPMTLPVGITPMDVISRHLFPSISLFPDAVSSNVSADGPKSAQGELAYRTSRGSPGHAQLVCVDYGKSCILCAIAGPAGEFESAVPVLSRIVKSHNGSMLTHTGPRSGDVSRPLDSMAGSASGPPPLSTLRLTSQGVQPAAPLSGVGVKVAAAVAAFMNSPAASPGGAGSANAHTGGPGPSAGGPTGSHAAGGVRPVNVFFTQAQTAAPINYVRFTDPQLGSFTIDVPVGWQVRGGLNHPGLGDLRAWFEVNSPDGIYIISDPNFPQILCHQAMWFTGKVVDVGAGGRFLSLKPNAESSADHYLKTVGTQALPHFIQRSRRPRPDAIELVKQACAAAGVKMGWGSRIGGIETILERQGHAPAVTASLLTTCAFNGNYGVGTAFWSSLNVLCVAPAGKAGIADAVRMQILRSFKETPQMKRINEVDTQIIYSNAMEEQRRQWQMFNAMQQAHYSQMAAGDSIVSNYWSQQRTNESIYRGWEQNQAVYDRLSQDRSDAMMGRQRLADVSAGYTYDVESGSNYYWRNPQTGQVFGTQTDQPPDYSNNYTSLQIL